MKTVAKQSVLDPKDEAYLLELASATWGYFESYVDGQNHWLPPDNIQEYPALKVATRISPTNEGMFLVSTMVARELGFVSLDRLVMLLQKNLDSWLGLPTFHGHHFNWYETRSLEPLTPRYVSTVDSGNLLASYLTVSAGVGDILDRPVFGAVAVQSVKASVKWLVRRMRASASDPKWKSSQVRSLLDGFIDYLETSMWMLDQSLKIETSWKLFVERIDVLESRLRHMEMQLTTGKQEVPLIEVKQWIHIIAQRLEGMSRESRRLVPWMFTDEYAELLEREVLEKTILTSLTRSMRMGATLNEVFRLPKHLVESDGKGSSEYHVVAKGASEGAAYAQDIIERLYSIKNRCDQAAESMTFRFLLNERRDLFSIGFNLEIGAQDKNCYDLLCSECRLASFLAIARGDVEAEHWFRLGRQATSIHGEATLLSWGGTMFEYLMPNLFMHTNVGTLIDNTCRTIVRRQIEHGRELGIPWGVSESAYASLSSNSDYQYRSFGVPGLGLKRGLAKDQVVSPYSTFLALPWALKSGVQNLVRMEEFAVGTWGFYDAIDFTRARLRKNERFRTVRNYMAHHHGMSLISLCNVLRDNIIQKWFHANAIVRANQLLLEEKALPYATPKILEETDEEPSNSRASERIVLSRVVRGLDHSTPKVHLLSNGRLTSYLNHVGGGYCQWGQMLINRWRADATSEAWGQFIYLRDQVSQEEWSPTLLPTLCQPDHYEVVFSADKAEFHRRQGTIETQLEVVVSPEHLAEVRQLRITNRGDQARTIEVTTYQEVSLATKKSDLAHPAFQKLFIETEYIAEDATLIARRRPRELSQKTLYAIHTLAVPPAFADTVHWETSREKFLGRLGDVRDPLAASSDELSGTTGAVLDAIFSLRCTVVVPAGESIVLGITTAVAESKEEAMELSDLYHDLRGVQRALELAWAFAQVETKQDNFDARRFHLFHQLAGYLLCPGMIRDSTGAANENRLSQNSLWRFGVSGDLPILLWRIHVAADVELLHELLEAQVYLERMGIQFDLILLNEFPGSYFDSLQDELQSVIANRALSEFQTKHLFIFRRSALTTEDITLLSSSATMIMKAQNGRLEQQFRRLESRPNPTPIAFRKSKLQRKRGNRSTPEIRRVPSGRMDLKFPNGKGGFIRDGYWIHASRNDPLPAPWSNVLANAEFGTIVTEAGEATRGFEIAAKTN